jgi:hypothetical protein
VQLLSGWVKGDSPQRLKKKDEVAQREIVFCESKKRNSSSVQSHPSSLASVVNPPLPNLIKVAHGVIQIKFGNCAKLRFMIKCLMSIVLFGDWDKVTEWTRKFSLWK